jgi:5-methylcytosine-specific restriction endonuclease McrA
LNSPYKLYLRTKKWKEKKKALIKLRGRLCEICASTKRLEIHHLSYQNLFNEPPEDLLILCPTCHKKQHGIKKKKPNPNKARNIKLKKKFKAP